MKEMPTLDTLHHVVRHCISPNTEQCTQCSIRYSLAHGFRLVTFAGANMVVHLSRLMASLCEAVGTVEVCGSQSMAGAPMTWTVQWWEPGVHTHVSTTQQQPQAKGKEEDKTKGSHTKTPTVRLRDITRSVRWTPYEAYTIQVISSPEPVVQLVSPRGWDISVCVPPSSVVPEMSLHAGRACLEFRLDRPLTNLVF